MQAGAEGEYMLHQQPSLPLASDGLPHLPQPPTMHMKGENGIESGMEAAVLHAEQYSSLPPPPPELQTEADVHAEVHALRQEVAKLKEELVNVGSEVMVLKKIIFPGFSNMPAADPNDPAAYHQLAFHHAAAAAAATDGSASLPHSLEGYHANGLHALHAAASAAAEGMYGSHLLPAGAAPEVAAHVEKPNQPKRARVESLQLEMDEQEVIQELRARGLINDNPPEVEDARKGGRPPLGMGALKRVKDMYDKRQISMEAWRSYYQEKCRESGFDAKPHQHHKRHKFPGGGGGGDGGVKHSVSYTFPAYNPNMLINDSEVRLVRTLCGELTYPPDTDPSKKFSWNKAMPDEHNLEALRQYLLEHRPSKNRRGKKPTGIENFPMVFDLWAASFIESSQFRRICKYAQIPIEQYQEDVQDNSQEEPDEEDPHGVAAAHYAAHHAVPSLPLPPLEHHVGAHEHSQLDALQNGGLEAAALP